MSDEDWFWQGRADVILNSIKPYWCYRFPANKNPVWTTKDFREVAVKKMDSDHIKNARTMLLNVLVREEKPPERQPLRHERARAWIGVFDRELNRRGLA